MVLGYYKYEESFDPQVMPVITLEVMPDTFNNIQSNETIDENPRYPSTESMMKALPEIKEEQEANENVENVNAKGKTDFLEYMTRNDGSVVCKLCGEILQSRTHWYRHKYKLHVVQP
ncbi:hypothetical protein EVAR_95378_1 [Eumeta japonica]|uniref:C2H2-type domain-containing protein n=1 Tax=Eumeta variegata TaxID=151549 RepID=A0A4C1ZY37_EUMVA|nr:hypothetical protein EVAR_95378_1 [Eumeta japonica]